MKVLSAAEMRRAEAAADAAGLSYAEMMERAGAAVAQEIMRHLDVRGKTVLVLVGPGNNGGDGLVAAHHLHAAQARVWVYLWRARPETDVNFRRLMADGVSILIADAGQAELERLAGQADVIVDALLGTGAARPIEGTMKAALDAVRSALAGRAKRPLVVAVDLPSGLNADSGEIDAAALPADLTVTFAFPKRGHYLFPGAGHVGELVVADIGIPDHAAADAPLSLADADTVAALLPSRPRDAHKGTFGKLLVVAGCPNYTGAAYLASMAAYRVGTGLVTLGVARTLHPILAAKASEVTFLPLADVEGGYLSPEALPALTEALPRYDALLVGCGLGSHPQTRSLVQRLVGGLAAHPHLRLVVDADGLNALSVIADWPSLLPAGTVLTPHPGEMARLSGLDMAAIAGDRIGVATTKAAAWGHVVVLKGAYTVIAAPNGRATINPFANPALATAGTGDVLAGAIAGLLAQGLAPHDAAVCGAYLHASAAGIVCEELGDSGLVAGDLLPTLPQAVRRLRSASTDGDGKMSL